MPATPADLTTHDAVIYDQRGSGVTWTFKRGSTQKTVTLSGRLRMTAAEGVREAVFADLGLTVAWEWIFAPELRSSEVLAGLKDWTLPPIDLWAVFSTSRRKSAKARAFAAFVETLVLRNTD